MDVAQVMKCSSGSQQDALVAKPWLLLRVSSFLPPPPTPPPPKKKILVVITRWRNSHLQVKSRGLWGQVCVFPCLLSSSGATAWKSYLVPESEELKRHRLAVLSGVTLHT